MLSETRDGVLTSYQYDADGNRARKIAPAATAVYNWDGAGRLAAVDTNDDGTPDFLADYDYRTRRIRTQVRDGGGGLTETRFRYDGGVAFDELDAQGNVKSGFTRVSGLGGGVASIVNSSKPAQDGRPARKEHYIYNAVGHSVLLVDGDCVPVQVNLFEAFGGIEQTWGNSDNNRLANTKERDASIALDNHGFRYYDASIGRYISNDPISYEGGFNLYVHCTNDPVNKFDPLGLKEREDLEKQHKKIEDRAQKIRDRIKDMDDKAQSGELSGKALRKAERELKSEYKLYLNDLGKAGELAKAYTDSKWFPDSELAGKHMGYAVTFDGLELDRGNVKALGKILETEAKFGEAIHDAAGRYAAAGYTMKGLEYAGDAATIALGGVGLAQGGKLLLKQVLKEGLTAGAKTLGKQGAKMYVAGVASEAIADDVATIAENQFGVSREYTEAGIKIAGIFSMRNGIKKFQQANTQTGRVTPKNLKEKLAMEEVVASPQGSHAKGMKMSDTRNQLLHSDGWRKMEQVVNGVKIHYVDNINTNITLDFKFK